MPYFSYLIYICFYLNVQYFVAKTTFEKQAFVLKNTRNSAERIKIKR